jgi:hypothetical protein
MPRARRCLQVSARARGGIQRQRLSPGCRRVRSPSNGQRREASVRAGRRHDREHGAPVAPRAPRQRSLRAVCRPRPGGGVFSRQRRYGRASAEAGLLAGPVRVRGSGTLLRLARRPAGLEPEGPGPAAITGRWHPGQQVEDRCEAPACSQRRQPHSRWQRAGRLPRRTS